MEQFMLIHTNKKYVYRRNGSAHPRKFTRHIRWSLNSQTAWRHMDAYSGI